MSWGTSSAVSLRLSPTATGGRKGPSKNVSEEEMESEEESEEEDETPGTKRGRDASSGAGE